jgi:hypothetical protein
VELLVPPVAPLEVEPPLDPLEVEAVSVDPERLPPLLLAVLVTELNEWEEMPVPQPHAAMAIPTNVLRIRVRITAAILVSVQYPQTPQHLPDVLSQAVSQQATPGSPQSSSRVQPGEQNRLPC